MSQNNEDDQQCFIPAHWQESPAEGSKDQDFLYLNINRLLQEAKQLHNRTRPQTMQPRTCFLELPIKKLPQYLQQPCIELELQQNQTGPFVPIDNPEHLSISQFFRDHEVVYNKMKMYNRPSFELTEPTCRFKPISQLFDFHQKLFKELYAHEAIKSPTHIAINDDFDSCFESGNLGLVFKKEETPQRQYFLLLENDVNTHGYTSWFFFKVKSCGKGKAFFHIVNMSKSPYLYKIGFKISIFSVGKYNENKIGWFKGGKNIQTYSTNFEKKAGRGDTYSCLYFQYDFEENQSEVYFAMSKPFTYSMLKNSLKQMENKFEVTESNVQFQIIKSIYSTTCNIIPIVVLKELRQNENVITFENATLESNKKAIVFMARQHPGQIVGSYFMDKIMQIFMMETEEVKQLMSQYTIILIPMVNPDGVIHGNSRCNFSGLDLNRQWMKQSFKEVTPETNYLRKLLWQIDDSIGIQYVIDLHGHSKKMNSFFFCNKINEKYPSEYLPCVISMINKRFDRGSCTFNTTIDKKNTLRNQLYENGMKNCVTVENSYFGFWQEKIAKHFTDKDFFQMADSLIKALHFILNQDFEKCKGFMELFHISKDQLANEVKIYKESNAKKQYKAMENNEIQSESQPEGDIMQPEQMLKIYQKEPQILKKEPQKRKVRPKKPKKIQVDKEDDIRASEPMKMNKEVVQPIQSKPHKSQKKLETVINNKKSLTQQKFREPQKPVALAQKKNSFKREQPIRQKVMSMNNEEQIESIATKETKMRGKIFGVPFPKPNYENYLINKTSNKSRLIQTRFRTDVETSKSRMEKDSTSYGKIKEESIKIFLNQTLSISKVNNHPSNTYITNGLNQMKGRKESAKPNKFYDKTQRVQTSQNRSMSKIGLQIDNNSSGISIAKQRQDRKRFLSRNYKKELVRRKKILNTQEEVKKYKRFQNFVSNQQEKDGKKVGRLECSSVFYYFPVL